MEVVAAPCGLGHEAAGGSAVAYLFLFLAAYVEAVAGKYVVDGGKLAGVVAERHPVCPGSIGKALFFLFFLRHGRVAVGKQAVFNAVEVAQRHQRRI